MTLIPVHYGQCPGDSRQDGVSLLEVLVAILVLSIGLLGLGSLQATGLRMSNGAYLRGIAAQSALDMADRMRANKRAACDGNYSISIGDSAPGDSNELPKKELKEWFDTELSALPAGDGSITISKAAGSDCDNPQTLVTAVIIVEWDDQRAGVRGETPDETPSNAATNARLMLSTRL